MGSLLLGINKVQQFFFKRLSIQKLNNKLDMDCGLLFHQALSNRNRCSNFQSLT